MSNYRKVMIAGATAAVIVGAGGTAMAVSGSNTTNGSATGKTSTSTSAGQKAGKHGAHKHNKDGKLLRRLEHGQFVTKGKDGKTVTHDLIRGTVTSVSATSITVKAADSTTETFTVGKTTKVVAKAKGQKPAATTITKIAKGADVFVTGTGTGTLTATHVAQVPAK